MAPSPKGILTRSALKALTKAERGWDLVRYNVLGRGMPEQTEIICFAGYRNARRVFLKGRVIAARKPLAPGAGTLSRIRTMLRTYHSHEVPGAALNVTLHGRTHRVTTDAEGYFELDIEHARPLPATTEWETARVTPTSLSTMERSYEHPVLVPGGDRRLAIISDIDDTVIETGVQNFLKNWRRVLVEQPEERLVVPGAVELYQAIAHHGGVPVNPVFYVSSSPWNLYPFLHKFMTHNDLPFGPMFLKDWGITETKLIGGSHVTHKIEAVEQIIGFFPSFRFILIGDNGQKDMEVYARVVRDYPGKVAGVFIRDVTGAAAAGESHDALMRIEAAGVPTYLGPTLHDAIPVVQDLGVLSAADEGSVK